MSTASNEKYQIIQDDYQIIQDDQVIFTSNSASSPRPLPHTQVGSDPLPKASGWVPKDVVRLVQAFKHSYGIKVTMILRTSYPKWNESDDLLPKSCAGVKTSPSVCLFLKQSDPATVHFRP